MSTDSGLLTSSETPGISARGQGIDGIHWNILGQVYTPKSITERCFSWHAMLPIESFVPPHIHPTQDEYIQVLSGELDLLLDGKRQRAQAGDLVRMPMGIAHGIFNNSGADATALFWVTPTGKLVDLFRKIHNMAHPGEVTAVSPDYEVEFLPPVRAADQL
jgi:mannose-6-phosphate isomerase-like protein (cupin superfamily)